MSTVQQPWRLRADEQAAAGSDAPELPSAFHVVLGIDGSVAIERSHEAPPALPAELTPQEPPADVPLTAALRQAYTQTPLAPPRQLRWSFAAGALAATAVLIAGHQLYERWSETAQAPHVSPSGSTHEAAAVSAAANEAPPDPRLAAEPPTAQAAVALPPEPPAAGRPAPARRAAELPRESAPTPTPTSRRTPCLPAVAALALCTPTTEEGGS